MTGAPWANRVQEAYVYQFPFGDTRSLSGQPDTGRYIRGVRFDQEREVTLRVNGCARHGVGTAGHAAGCVAGPTGADRHEKGLRQGECGACTVHVAERRVLACMALAVAVAGHQAGLDSLEAEVPLGPGQQGGGRSIHTYGAVFVEVRVDADLGLVRMPRCVATYAAGRIINPLTAQPDHRRHHLGLRPGDPGSLGLRGTTGPVPIQEPGRLPDAG